MNVSRALAVFVMPLSALAQQGGPAILTRGEVPAAMATPEVAFRPFFEINGVYDTGLTGVAVVNPQGDLAHDSAFGMELSGGVSGLHEWKYTKLGLDYHASLYHYTKKTYYDGTDQSLMLGLKHQLSRHTTLSLRESAGLFARNFSYLGLPQSVPFDPATSQIPTTDFFDNRTLYLSTQADLTMQKSARLSFNLGGDGFLARRRSTALYGVTGGGARGDVQYRISRYSTIGAEYLYTHYDFNKVFGGTDLHGGVVSYAVRFTRSLEFTAYAGFLRTESKFIQTVPVDPAVAALIGASFGNIVVHRIDYLPNVSGRLSRTFSRGVAYLTGSKTVTPGNGLFLTTRLTSGSAGYAYTGLRRWSFRTEAGFDDGRSIGNVLGVYRDYNGTVTISRQIARSFHAVFLGDVRQYDSPDFTRYNRLIYRLRIGIGFSPGDIPLRVW